MLFKINWLADVEESGWPCILASLKRQRRVGSPLLTKFTASKVQLVLALHLCTILLRGVGGHYRVHDEGSSRYLQPSSLLHHSSNYTEQMYLNSRYQVSSHFQPQCSSSWEREAARRFSDTTLRFDYTESSRSHPWQQVPSYIIWLIMYLIRVSPNLMRFPSLN